MSFLQRRNEQARQNGNAVIEPIAERPVIAPPPMPIKAEVKEEKPREGEYQVPPKLYSSAKIAQLRKQFRSKLLATPDEADDWVRGDAEKEQIIMGRLKTVIQKAGVQLTASEIEELKEGLLNDLMGLGAIEPLVQNKSVSEIMVTGADMIFAEQKGKLIESEYVFDDEDHVQFTAQRIIRPLGRTFNRANPMARWSSARWLTRASGDATLGTQGHNDNHP